MKTCSHCKREKSSNEFCRNSRAKDGLNGWCKTCTSKGFQSWHDKVYTPEYGRIRNLKKYGLTPEEFNLRLQNQDFRCAICKKTASELKPYNHGQVFGVDHNHQTKKVRGLLCQECNRALGLFHEDQAALQMAVVYLNQ